MTKPFPRDDLLRRAGGDAQVLAEVIAIARSTWPREAEELLALVRSGDAEKVSRAAHALAGSMGNFTAGEAVTAARAIELNALAGSLDGAESLAETVKKELLLLLAAL